jgi:predicted nucleotide-binding protein
LDILNVAFSEAQAILIVLSPDDLAYLRPELQKPNDPEWERREIGQARPNVLFELGMALATGINRTVVVQVGDVRQFSDIAGRHILRLTNEPGDKSQLVDRLKPVGCPLDVTGKTHYFKTGDFTPRHLKTRYHSKTDILS